MLFPFRKPEKQGWGSHWQRGKGGGTCIQPHASCFQLSLTAQIAVTQAVGSELSMPATAKLTALLVLCDFCASSGFMDDVVVFFLEAMPSISVERHWCIWGDMTPGNADGRARTEIFKSWEHLWIVGPDRLLGGVWRAWFSAESH